MRRVADHPGTGVTSKVEVLIIPVDGQVAWIGHSIQAHVMRPQVEAHRRGEAISVSTRNSWIADATPDGMEGRGGKGHAGLSRGVEPSDEILQIMSPTPAPDEDTFESLVGEGGKDGQDHRFMQRDGDVDKSGTVIPMLGRWPKRQSWKHEGIDTIHLSSALRCGMHEVLGEPGVEVDRQVRPLLLSTPGRDNGDCPRIHSLPYLLVCQIPVSCAPFYPFHHEASLHCWTETSRAGHIG